MILSASSFYSTAKLLYCCSPLCLVRLISMQNETIFRSVEQEQETKHNLYSFERQFSRANPFK